MPIDNRLNAIMTTAQADAIRDAIDTIVTTLTAVADVQLSNQERQSTPSVSEQREPYAGDVIENLAPLYPALVGPEIPTAEATNNWNTSKTIKTLRAPLEEALDRLGDLEINAEYMVVKYMNDFYRNARDYRARNVPGANSAYDRLNEYYSRFGNPGAGDPAPDPAP
jgi:hypothetical protein